MEKDLNPKIIVHMFKIDVFIIIRIKLKSFEKLVCSVYIIMLVPVEAYNQSEADHSGHEQEIRKR